ncbi:MAG: TetR/AcrR family transcriptional regulator [Acidiphilium sp.]|nr:TetR/AcrR family transcriptional regulator [Acidiphilium sp.]MDD4936638.1 TetR/AcrR family transcriptional regulator [Acidiphilium sp.]
MRQPRTTRTTQTIGQILAAAERVFAEAGLAGATMAQLAAACGLPKANLHYYFGTKEALYTEVLQTILTLWLDAADAIHPAASPRAALTAYISAKMAHSRTRPYASKVFANEVLHGAVHLRSYLGLELRRKVDEKAVVIEGWITRGLMDPVDPRHLFFLLWAMTQTYADFDAQMAAVLAVPSLGSADFAVGEALILRLVLRGCGLGHDLKGTDR